MGDANPSGFVASMLQGEDAVVRAVPVTDTCKQVVDGVVSRTLSRESLVDVRGPWLIGRQRLATALGRVADDADVQSMLDICRLGRVPVRLQISE